MFIETNQTMQTNDSLVLCWHCWGGLGWQLIGGVNINNVSLDIYSQTERLVVAVIIHQVIFPVTPPVDNLLSWVPLPFWPT